MRHTVEEYSRATGIPVEKVRRMLRRGTLLGEKIPGSRREDGKVAAPQWVVMEPLPEASTGQTAERERQARRRERLPRKAIPRRGGAGSSTGRWPRKRPREQ